MLKLVIWLLLLPTMDGSMLGSKTSKWAKEHGAYAVHMELLLGICADN